MSCVITFPKHSIDGGQYGTSVHYPLHQFRTHGIYGHFLNGRALVPGADLGFFERGAKLDRDIGNYSQTLEDIKPFHKALDVRFM